MKKRKSKSPMQILISQLRNTPQYARWRDEILKRDVVSYPRVPKGTQVHHIGNISRSLESLNITTVSDAIRCKRVWQLPGIALTRGEHFLLSRLGFYKYPSPGFMTLLKLEIKRLNNNITPIGGRKK